MANSNKNGAPSSISAPIEYTEDRVPVCTLYLENIPQTTTLDELEKYFSMFGEVASVSIKESKLPQENFLCGFVEFTKPEYAAMALKQPIHPDILKCISVKPADTCKQPAIAQIVESKSILGLNDDCLINIFSFLNPIETLKLSFVCQRFYDIVKHAIKVTKFDFNEVHQNFTLAQIRQILTWFGSDIRRLHLDLRGPNEVCKLYLDFIGINCHNLEEVKFELLHGIHHETYKQFFNSSKQLHTMVLENCDITDEVCGMIGLLPALRSLNLALNWAITGQFLRNLNSLNELDLSYCINIEPLHFIDICGSLKLTSLNILGCSQLTDQAFSTLAETQTGLEQLVISDSYNAGRIALVGQLTALKHIRIHRDGRSPYLTNDILLEIVNNHKENLESLEIYNLLVGERNRDQLLELQNLRKFCLVRDKDLDDDYLEKLSKNCKLLERVNIAGSVLVSNNGIVDLVRNLKHLKYLNVSFCKQFSDHLIDEIYSILKDAADTEIKGPLILCVHETGIAESFLKKEKYQKYKACLSLSFDIDSFCVKNYDDMDFARDEIYFVRDESDWYDSDSDTADWWYSDRRVKSGFYRYLFGENKRW